MASARIGAGRCRSSVVEHSLGKGEVVGSIPTGSTGLSAIFGANLQAGHVPEMTERGASIRHRLVPKFANVPIAARLPGKHTTHLQANSFDIGADDAAAGFVTLACRELQILGTPKLAQIERSQPRGLDILFRPRELQDFAHSHSQKD